MATSGHTLLDHSVRTAVSAPASLPASHRTGNAALLPVCAPGARGSTYLAPGGAKQGAEQSGKSRRGRPSECQPGAPLIQPGAAPPSGFRVWTRSPYCSRRAPRTDALLGGGPQPPPCAGLSDSRSVSLHSTLLGTGKQTPPSGLGGPWGRAPTLGEAGRRTARATRECLRAFLHGLATPATREPGWAGVPEPVSDPRTGSSPRSLRGRASWPGRPPQLGLHRPHLGALHAAPASRLAPLPRRGLRGTSGDVTLTPEVQPSCPPRRAPHRRGPRDDTEASSSNRSGHDASSPAPSARGWAKETNPPARLFKGATATAPCPCHASSHLFWPLSAHPGCRQRAREPASGSMGIALRGPPAAGGARAVIPPDVALSAGVPEVAASRRCREPQAPGKPAARLLFPGP